MRRWMVGLTAVAACCNGALAATPRPNVVVILSDDQGWGDLSVHGNTNLATPHIDSLARDGALFERFFVCPVCSPTRAEFLTGRYHPRCGVWSTSAGGERLDLDERTVADVFRAAGYATGAFGKWHNGTQHPYHPNARGFDEYYGFCSGHWGDYFDPVLEHNSKTVRGKGFIADDFTDKAIAFIEAHRAEPFFCYVPYNTPHSPVQVPDRFFDKFRGAELKLRDREPEREDAAFTRAALAMCENIDWNVGRILVKLEELELVDDTIVLYFADNGPNGPRWNGDMKGRKASTDEGGVRAPLAIRYPRGIRPGTHVAPIAAAIDLLPTLAELARIELAPARPLDGRSLVPLLSGRGGDWPERLLFSHWSGKVSVRSQRHRLDATGKLFDMLSDPGQRRDVAAERPDVAQELARAAAEWRRDVLGELARDAADKRPFTVGYGTAATPLPARDGVAHGGIERSARPPNCSFYRHWKSTADAITWDVDVRDGGTYQAVVYYTCPAAELGATVELSCGTARTVAQVTRAHDPPLIGAEHDRVPRAAESLVKDFAPLELGTLELAAGRGTLKLQALAIPAGGVMDVRGIVLTRVR